MGNTTTKEFGDFQEGAGKFSSDVNLVGAYIFCGILIVIAIGLAIFAIIPRETGSNFSCSSTDPCFQDEECVNGKCSKGKKRHLWVLGVSAGLILLGLFIVWLSKWWQKEVYSNRTVAQIGGTIG